MSAKRGARILTLILIGMSTIYCGLIYKLGQHDGEEAALQEIKERVRDVFGVEN